jgi:hypothetical protein
LSLFSDTGRNAAGVAGLTAASRIEGRLS